MEYAYNIFLLLGGIGMFLFGINFMSLNLELAAGDNLRLFLEKFTKKPLSALLIGAGTTAAIQSSGATMVMTANFVNAKMMDLTKALYVMLGASIGTTITAQIIAFDIDSWAPLILFIGAVLYLFFKDRLIRRIGGIVLGFGILFEGINLMGMAITALELGSIVKAFLANFSNPVLAILFGFVFTFIIQSSSAAIGILQVVAMAQPGAFTLGDLVFLILGMNLGALAPLLIFSFKGGADTSRVTFSQTCAKTLSVVIFAVVTALIPQIPNAVQYIAGDSLARGIADFHLLYNIVAAFIIFPLIPSVAKLGYKVFPRDPNADKTSRKLLYLTTEAIDTKNHIIVLSMARREIIRFAELCTDNLKLAIRSFFERNESLSEQVSEMEKTINVLCHEINVALVKIYGSKMPERELARVAAMFNVVSDYERIADHAENISEYTVTIKDTRANLSESAFDDLHRMTERVLKIIDVAEQAYTTEDHTYLGMAREIEDSVDALQEELIDNHIARMGEGTCDPRGGVIYTDLVSDLERIADHAMNISESILGLNAPIEHAEESEMVA
jgi:phosphate:Na+ symporter